MTRFFASAMIALFTLALSFGCKDKGTNPEEELAGSSFEAQISGALNSSVKGCAVFTTDIGQFQLILTALSSQSQIFAIELVRDQVGRPVTGIYSVSESAEFVGLVLGSGGQAFVSQSGTLTVTASSASEVRGSFNFTATEGAQTVTVSGRFNADPPPCKR